MQPKPVPIHVSATCDSNFVRILDVYRQLKINRQIQYLVLLFLPMVPFSHGIGFLGLFLTISVCVATMVYLVVQQEKIISQMQKSLYQICLRSISEQTETLANPYSQD